MKAIIYLIDGTNITTEIQDMEALKIVMGKKDAHFVVAETDRTEEAININHIIRISLSIKK